MSTRRKDTRNFLEELKDLGFTWEFTSQSHIKAIAPDGEILIFSIGGRGRTDRNQRSLLNRWKRNYAEVTKGDMTPEEAHADIVRVEVEMEEVNMEEVEISDLATKAFEAMVYTIRQAVVSDESEGSEELRIEVEMLTEEVERLQAQNEHLSSVIDSQRSVLELREQNVNNLSAEIKRLEEVEKKYEEIKKVFG